MKSRKVKEDFIQALRKTFGNVSDAAARVHISRKTYYDWLKRDKRFAEQCAEVSEGVIDFAESALKKLIREGNPSAIIFYLKTKGKERGYIEYKRVESENTVAIDLPKIDLSLVGGDDDVIGSSTGEPPAALDSLLASETSANTVGGADESAAKRKTAKRNPDT